MCWKSKTISSEIGCHWQNVEVSNDFDISVTRRVCFVISPSLPLSGWSHPPPLQFLFCFVMTNTPCIQHILSQLAMHARGFIPLSYRTSFQNNIQSPESMHEEVFHEEGWFKMLNARSIFEMELGANRQSRCKKGREMEEYHNRCLNLEKLSNACWITAELSAGMGRQPSYPAFLCRKICKYIFLHCKFKMYGYLWYCYGPRRRP